jgi:hypothetical protein
MDNILAAQGFEHELGGGGCTLLSRYFDDAGFAWVTCTDGGGYPSPDDWHVCAYGDDIDEILFMARSDDAGAMTLEQAVEQALAHARDFTSAHALCRNGNPIADCRCC